MFLGTWDSVVVQVRDLVGDTRSVLRIRSYILILTDERRRSSLIRRVDQRLQGDSELTLETE